MAACWGTVLGTVSGDPAPAGERACPAAWPRPCGRLRVRGDRFGVFAGRSCAAAGMEGGTDRVDPADRSRWLWEDEMETWLAMGGRLPVGPGGFTAGQMAGRRRHQGVVNPEVCILCSTGWDPTWWCPTQWYLVWWYATWWVGGTWSGGT